MSENKFLKTFSIIEETSNNRHNILSLLLSINLSYTKIGISNEVNCIICCSKVTEDFIKNFPFDFSINIVFFDENKQITGPPSIMKYLKNVELLGNYAIKTYGECLFIYHDFIMVNPISISNKVKDQKYGVMKKFFNGHNEESNYEKYSLEMIYVNDIIFFYYLNLLIGKNNLLNPSGVLTHPNYLKIPTLLNKTYPKNFKHHLNSEYVISTEDFFTFNNPLKLKMINFENFSLNESPISFLNCRNTSVNPNINKLNADLLHKLILMDRCYISILSIRNPKKKIRFITPEKKDVGIWNRELKPPQLYPIIEYFTTNYKDYCSSEELYTNYFNVSGKLLLDLPSKEYIHNTMKQYNEILLCNYDNSLLETIDEVKKPNKFIFHFPTDYNEIETILKKNGYGKKTIEFIELNSSISSNKLSRIRYYKYILLPEKDFLPSMMTCMALGSIPVLREDPGKLYEMQEGKHYLIGNVKNSKLQFKTRETITYDEMRNNCLTYYKENVSPDVCLKKLLNHIFVGNIE